jgi:ParB-like chromosome segregation protein Spo0J
MSDNLKQAIDDFVRNATDKAEAIAVVRSYLHEIHPNKSMPIDLVRWIPIDKVVANDYNPNSVAKNEMKLLHTSISHDGYTQPVVAIYDKEQDKYVIVDGFHRYSTMRNYDDIRESCNGMLPVVVIEKEINDRMASTVRHNRARGKHSVTGMASMVFQMLDKGWEDARICNELGMEAEELLRLKHITGFSKLFENVEYQKAWESRKQLEAKKEWVESHSEDSDKIKQA